jgi:predicted molibdopterin-dependent oxidoreductase YjgC
MNDIINESIKVEIDGQEVELRPGQTLLDGARELGIEIPTLCQDDRVDSAGCCRMCLVEIDGQRRLQPSCAYPAGKGMKVTTRNERIDRHRKGLLSLYKADHSLDDTGKPVSRGVNNRLADYIDQLGTGPELPAIHAKRVKREADLNPYIQFDPESCVVCGLCVRYCDEVEAVSAITLLGRGSETTIGTADQKGLLDTSCELCGGCVAVCPTGAMTEKPSVDADPDKETVVRSTCNFCGVGCQLNLHVQDEKVVRVTSPPPGETVNDGNLCVKGRFAYEFVHHEDRLTTPLIRGEDGQLHPASWDEAIDAVAKGLRRVEKKHGTETLGFISSSRCTGEENYLMQKLARAAFGTNNCHQCAAT